MSVKTAIGAGRTVPGKTSGNQDKILMTQGFILPD
jgi:hypothetical protein